MRVRWGINASDVDDYDRSKQFKPYNGPEPKNGVYAWKVKVVKSIPATKENLPQLRVGLELIPRETRTGERKYSGYFTMLFISISDRMMWKLVPFLDAIGVSGTDFTSRTLTDEEGNVKKIGRWRNTGDTVILAELKDGEDKAGNPRKEIGWVGEFEEDEDPEEDEELEEEDDDYDEEIDPDDYDEDDDDEGGWDEDEEGF